MPLSIAVVARRSAVPIFTGINLIVHHITCRLAKNFRVGLFLTDDDAVESLPGLAIPVKACGKSSYGNGGAAAAANGEYGSLLARFYNAPARRIEWLKREVTAFNADVVLGFGYDVAVYLQPLQQQWPVVCDPIDSEVLYLWRLLRRGELRLSTLKHLLMSIALARRALAPCDALITVSDEDTRNLEWITGHRRVVTIPNGVDCDFFSPRRELAPIPGRIIFSGSLSWPPNAQAIGWFLENCWERILASRPDATLHIVGKGMSAEQQRLYSSHRNVTAVGFVDDIRDHVLAAELSIAPMVSGSGIKNKVLESWAMGRAVVATPLAARGLKASHGQQILVASGPAEFADAVLSVLENSELRDCIGASGRSMAIADYSWDSMADRFGALLQQAAKERRR